jgi:hypothetical protein
MEEIDALIETVPDSMRKLFLKIVRTDYFVSRTQLKYLQDNKENYMMKLEHAEFVYNIYSLFSLSDRDIGRHWVFKREQQADLHYSYSSMAKNPRQDNKDYINRGSGDSNAYSLRRPKLCRKTAWKRFYKLFPRLKK